MLSRMRDPRTGRPNVGVKVLAVTVALLLSPPAAYYVVAPALRAVADLGWWDD